APCLARLLTSRLARTLAPPKKLETAINKNSEMKTNNLFLLPVLIAALAWMSFGRVTAQTFTTLHSFTALNNSTNSDGLWPAGLILSSNTLYGTAESGGSGGNGTVFKLNTDGTGFTTLYSFIGGSDGAIPNGGLNLTKNTLYGATYVGSSGNGTAFAVNTDGTGFTNLLYLGRDAGGLILSGNTLYGTESGSYGWGV